jgi:hypothetical protein
MAGSVVRRIDFMAMTAAMAEVSAPPAEMR